MQIYEKNESVLYKAEGGARIMIRISLPLSGEGTELDILYDRLFSAYLSAAKRFVNSSLAEGNTTYYFTIRYESEFFCQKLKIKRFSSLKKGRTPLREAVAVDWFQNDGFKLKK